MATYLYAATINKLPLTDFAITAESGGSTTQTFNYSYHISVLCRGGKNLDSDGVNVAIAPGQRLKITLNASIRKEVSEEFQILLSADTGDSTQAKILAYWDAKDAAESDQVLPVTFYLTSDVHFVLGGEVASFLNLPSVPMKGTTRYIIDAAQYRQWDGSQWKIVSGWDTYLSSTTQARTGTLIYGGCHRSIASIPDTEVIAPPIYEGGVSTPLRLWLVNGLSEGGGTDIQSGELVDLLVSVNGDPLDAIALSGSIFVEVGQTFRKLDGTGEDNDLTGTQSIWYYGNNQFLFRLPMSLPRGFGVELIVSLSTDQLADGEAVIISPVVKGKYGDKDSAARFLGSCVFSGGDRLRIIPSLSGIRRLSGSGLVATTNDNGVIIDGYSFDDPDPDDLIGLAADAADQKVVISGALGGYTSIYQSGTAIPKDRAIRAIVSTVGGTAAASPWSNTIQLTSNQVLSLNIAWPCDEDGIGTIRANYPDVIAGMIAEFSANFYIYLEINGAIRRSPLQSTNFQPSQIVSIDSLTGWDTVSALPVSPFSAFCLWGYEGLVLSGIAGTGSLTTGTNIRVCIAYHYPSPNSQITSISHSADDGCTPELEITLIEAIERSKYIGVVNAADTVRGYLEDKIISNDEMIVEVGESSISFHPKYWREPVDSVEDLESIENPINGELRFVFSEDKIRRWKAATSSWAIVAGGGGAGTPEEIRNALAGLIGENRLSAAAIKETTELRFLPGAAQPKVLNLPENTIQALEGKAATSHSHEIENINALNTTLNAINSALAQRLIIPGSISQNGMILSINTNGTVIPIVLNTSGGTTTTTAGFTQPDIGSSVIVTVGNNVFVVGQYVFMATGGAYEVGTPPQGTNLPANNVILVNRNNSTWPALPGSPVSSGKLVVAAGKPGEDGISAITYTSDSFNIPALNAFEEVNILSSGGLLPEINIKIDNAGTFRVASITNSTTIQIENIGSPDVETVGALVPSGQTVVVVGLRGETGAVEAATALELLIQETEPTTETGKINLFAAEDGVYQRGNGESSIKLANQNDIDLIDAAIAELQELIDSKADTSALTAAVNNLQAAIDTKISISQKGAANGVATLGSDGILSLSQRPMGIGTGDMTEAEYVSESGAGVVRAAAKIEGVDAAGDDSFYGKVSQNSGFFSLFSRIRQLLFGDTSPSFSQGDLLYWDGSKWANLAKGGIGQILTTTTNALQWASPSSSGGIGRELLTGERTYYVRSDNGNDDNDGLSDNSAFASLDKIFNIVASLDIGNYPLNLKGLGDFSSLSKIDIKYPIGSGGKVFLESASGDPNSFVLPQTNIINQKGNIQFCLRNLKIYKPNNTTYAPILYLRNSELLLSPGSLIFEGSGIGIDMVSSKIFFDEIMLNNANNVCNLSFKLTPGSYSNFDSYVHSARASEFYAYSNVQGNFNFVGNNISSFSAAMFWAENLSTVEVWGANFLGIGRSNLAQINSSIRNGDFSYIVG